MKKMKKWQMNIFILCWGAYTLAYLVRANLSIAMPDIQSTLNFTKTQMGLLGSIFFWAYGIGQLINGYIGDKHSSKRLIFIGLLASSLVNLIFGFTTNYIIMAILWMINGYFLSMLWGPIMRTITYWFPADKRGDVAIGISTSMVLGFLLAWGVIGIILSYTKWNWAFWIPGIILFIFSIIFLIFAKDKPEEANLTLEFKDEVQKQEDSEMSLIKIIKETKLWLVVIACYAQGIVKDGITLWAPTLIMETHNLNIKSTVQFIIFIPIMNFFGIILAKWLNKKLQNKEKLTTIILFGIGIIMLVCLIKLGVYSPLIAIIFLGLSSAMMYGANTILLGVIPLNYAKYNRTSAVAGFLDFNSYMAAGVTALITGVIVQSVGWNGVLIFWVVMMLFAIVVLYGGIKHEHAQVNHINESFTS